MKSKRVGKNTSEVEVTHISIGGIWLLLNDHEYFLPFEKFPWFKNATIGAIHDVQLIDGDKLRWPALEQEVAIESIAQRALVPSLD